MKCKDFTFLLVVYMRQRGQRELDVDLLEKWKRFLRAATLGWFRQVYPKAPIEIAVSVSLFTTHMV